MGGYCTETGRQHHSCATEVWRKRRCPVTSPNSTHACSRNCGYNDEPRYYSTGVHQTGRRLCQRTPPAVAKKEDSPSLMPAQYCHVRIIRVHAVSVNQQALLLTVITIQTSSTSIQRESGASAMSWNTKNVLHYRQPAPCQQPSCLPWSSVRPW